MAIHGITGNFDPDIGPDMWFHCEMAHQTPFMKHISCDKCLYAQLRHCIVATAADVGQQRRHGNRSTDERAPALANRKRHLLEQGRAGTPLELHPFTRAAPPRIACIRRSAYPACWTCRTQSREDRFIQCRHRSLSLVGSVYGRAVKSRSVAIIHAGIGYSPSGDLRDNGQTTAAKYIGSLGSMCRVVRHQ